jgi:hypothetical protein
MPGETREQAAAEIAAILARLKEEIRGGATRSAGDLARPAGRTLVARSHAERTWAVSAERPFEYSPNRPARVQAYLFVPVKRLLRKLMRWYVEPVAAQQRSFNLTVLRLVDELAERVEADVGRLEQRLEALEQQRLPESAEPRG